MSGSRSRRKGAQAERDLAKRFAEAMPGADCKRGIGQARRGSEVADCEVPRFFVESKHGKRPNPRAALAQCIEAAEANGNGKTPIAVIRDDRKEAFVCMRLDDFLGFVEEWWAAQQRKPTLDLIDAICSQPNPMTMPIGRENAVDVGMFGTMWRREDGKLIAQCAPKPDAEASCAALDDRDQGT
jgi:hypothetical protein